MCFVASTPSDFPHRPTTRIYIPKAIPIPKNKEKKRPIDIDIGELLPQPPPFTPSNWVEKGGGLMRIEVYQEGPASWLPSNRHAKPRTFFFGLPSHYTKPSNPHPR